MEIKHGTILYKAVSLTGQAVIKFTEMVLSISAREEGPVIPSESLPWTKAVEESTHLILAELNQLLTAPEAIPNIGDLSHEQQRIVTGGDGWRTFMLYAYGAAIDRNILRCPATDSVIRHIPGMTTAFFSILGPHTTLSPHRGPYKGVLRYHLGLIVPQPPESCGIRIAGAVHHWEVGGSLVFDDTFIHEAWNYSDEKRVVLFIDFKRDYIFPVSIFNDLMIGLIRRSPFISNILKNIEKATEGTRDGGGGRGTRDG